MDRPNADRQPSTSLANVTTKPYTPDGSYTAEGLALTTAAGAAAGLVAGVVFGFIGQWFYAIILFPIVIGLAIGTAQKFVIQKTKVRNTLACGAIGLLAGLFAVVTMHYVDFEMFKKYRAESAAEIEQLRVGVRQGVFTQAEFDEAMREYNQDPEVQAMRAVTSFPTYIDWAAHQGVELTGSRNSSAINLGYVGTYIYWGVDALIIAAMVVVMTRLQAAEPFCTECNRWKDSIEMGRLPAHAKQVDAAIGSGSFSTLTKISAIPSRLTAIKAFVCSNCQNAEDVVLEVNEVTYPKGQETLTIVGRYVSDATAIDQLTKFFENGVASEPVSEEEQQLLAAANSAYKNS